MTRKWTDLRDGTAYFVELRTNAQAMAIPPNGPIPRGGPPVAQRWWIRFSRYTSTTEIVGDAEVPGPLDLEELSDGALQELLDEVKQRR